MFVCLFVFVFLCFLLLFLFCKRFSSCIKCIISKNAIYCCQTDLADPVSTSESKLYEVIQPLGPDELQRLYQELGIPHQEVEKSEASVSSTDATLKAKAVIRTWKKRNGKKASVDALCLATERCRNIQSIPKGNTHDYLFLNEISFKGTNCLKNGM